MKFTFAENITLLNPVKIMEIFLSFSKSSFWKYKKKGKISFSFFYFNFIKIII